MVMYANEFETKEKLKLAEIKTELTASRYTYVFGGRGRKRERQKSNT